MTLIAVTARIEKWLYQTLTGDGTIAGIIGTRCYAGIGPQTNAIFPYVVYTCLSAVPVPGTGATRIKTRATYAVKAVAQANTVAPLQTLCDRIDQLLNGARGGTADATIQSSEQVEEIRLTTVEAPGATVYQHLGGTYLIEAGPLVNP